MFLSKLAEGATRVQAVLNGTKTAGEIDSATVHLSPNDMGEHVVGSYEMTAIAQLREKQKLGLLSGGDLSLAQAAYHSANFDAETMKQVLQMNAGAYSLDGQRSIERDRRESKDLLEAVKRLADQKDGSGGGSTHTVNINLNGRTRAVNTDAAGGRVLQDMLRELEQAAGRG